MEEVLHYSSVCFPGSSSWRQMDGPEGWYFDIPIITRVWITAAVLTSGAIHCDLVSPYQLFFSWRTVWDKSQLWRVITTFLYFGPLSLDFVFHLFFMSRYSRMLEESFYRGKTADFAWLILYAAASLLILSPIAGLPFLGSPLSFSLVYIWSRRNPAIRLSFLGLFIFSAPYLPWVLLAFSVLLNNSLPKGDMLGIAVGHIYFFFEDVYPGISNGSRPLAAPFWWKYLFRENRRPHRD